MTDDLTRLDALLDKLRRILEDPADDDDSAEAIWQRLDLLERTMGPEALGAMLRRQRVGQDSIDEAMAVLARRRSRA